MNRKFLIAVGLFSVVWTSGCAPTAEQQSAAARKKFEAAIDVQTKLPAKVELTGEPYIKGKLAVFNKGKIAFHKGQERERDANGKSFYVDSMYAHELEGIHAVSPEEIQTVALVDCDMLTKGVYKTTDGRDLPAKVEDCELTIIDRTREAVIFKRKFEKTPSPEQKIYGNSGAAYESAQQDIVQFLKNLPQK